MTTEAMPETVPAAESSPGPPGGGRQRMAWAVTLGALTLLLVGGGLWLGLRRAATTSAPPPTMMKSKPALKSAVELESLEGIVIEPARMQNLTASLRVTGTVELNPQANVVVAPLVSGRVTKVLVVQGDRVRAGQPLVALDSPEVADLHIRLHDAETRRDIAARSLQRVERDESRVALAQARARLAQAEANFERLKQLFESGVLSRQELQDAETAYATARAEYDFQRVVGQERDLREARAALEVANVEVKHIQDQLAALGVSPPTEADPTAEITLTAPLSGLVTERLANVGAFIPAGATLLTIADLRVMWVIAAVPETQLGKIRLGQPVEVHVPALGGQTLRGRVTFIEAQINADTRTARVRIDVPNPNERLRAGMFAEVDFLTSADAPQLVVPTTAVHRLGEQTVVFVAGASPREFHAREVEVGDAQGAVTPIRRGLAVGERVVTQGGLALKTRLAGFADGEE